MLGLLHLLAEMHKKRSRSVTEQLRFLFSPNTSEQHRRDILKNSSDYPGLHTPLT